MKFLQKRYLFWYDDSKKNIFEEHFAHFVEDVMN